MRECLSFQSHIVLMMMMVMVLWLVGLSEVSGCLRQRATKRMALSVRQAPLPVTVSLGHCEEPLTIE